MKKPDEDVGDKIIAEFKKQGLLTDAALAKLQPKLIAGTFTSSDWRLLFENDRPVKEEAK